MILNVGTEGASTAEAVQYDNSTSGLEADNVQGAVDEINDNLGGLRFGTDGEGNYGYFGADDSLIPFKSDELLLLLDGGASATSYNNGSALIANNKYFDTTDGVVCTKACSGIMHVRVRRPTLSGSGSGTTTVVITKNEETIYSKTASVNFEPIEFSCNVGDVLGIKVKVSANTYGTGSGYALFMGS